jgi:hypothetical protein
MDKILMDKILMANDDENENITMEIDENPVSKFNPNGYNGGIGRMKRVNFDSAKFKPAVTSYDDILKSMNMRVVDGKLEMISSPVSSGRQVTQSNNVVPGFQGMGMGMGEPKMRQLNPLEYRQLMIKRHNDMVAQKRRISQIKSKKMMFSSNNITIQGGGASGPDGLDKMFRIFGR